MKIINKISLLLSLGLTFFLMNHANAGIIPLEQCKKICGLEFYEARAYNYKKYLNKEEATADICPEACNDICNQKWNGAYIPVGPRNNEYICICRKWVSRTAII